MVGWHQQLNEYEFEQAPGVGDREAWRAAVHGVAKSWTRLRTELNCTQLLELLLQQMATRRQHCFCFKLHL